MFLGLHAYTQRHTKAVNLDGYPAFTANGYLALPYPVSDRIPDIKKAGLSCRISGHPLFPFCPLSVTFLSPSLSLALIISVSSIHPLFLLLSPFLYILYCHPLCLLLSHFLSFEGTILSLTLTLSLSYSHPLSLSYSIVLSPSLFPVCLSRHIASLIFFMVPAFSPTCREAWWGRRNR